MNATSATKLCTPQTKKQKKRENPYHRVLDANLTQEVNDGLNVL